MSKKKKNIRKVNKLTLKECEDLLAKLSKDKEIIWISGNHDEFLRKYSPLELGNIKVVDEYTERGVWFCHGDMYDGVVKLHWLGVLGSIGYDTAIVIDRFLS